VATAYERLRRAGPRYTSYPTVPHWSADFPQSAFDDALRAAQGPLDLYVHVPFCESQCTYCGCNMVVAGRRAAGTRYLDALERQIEGLPLAAARVPVGWIHLGGGTPTWLTPEELIRLYGMLARRFPATEGAEISVEADPAITTVAHLDALAACGARRLSLGVQSFDPVVLAAVQRPQEPAVVEALALAARQRGFTNLNLDLMIGLPHQTPARFAHTLARAITARPDRLAIFAYAHVPWLKPHQKRLPADALPSPAQRLALQELAASALSDAGYVAIGMDHFALPDDPLAVAQAAGRLGRGFMGYTASPGAEMLGLGPSAISTFDDTYAQHHSKLSRWWKAVEAGAPVVERGLRLSAEDRLRRAVITDVMCNFAVDFARIEARFGVDFRRHFGASLAALAPLEEAGFVALANHRLSVTPAGRPVVRNVAMAFDGYLARETGSAPRYSQTI